METCHPPFIKWQWSSKVASAASCLQLNVEEWCHILVTQRNHLENSWVFSCFKCGEEDPGTTVSQNDKTRLGMAIKMAQGKFRSDLQKQAAMRFSDLFYMFLHCLSIKKTCTFKCLHWLNIYICTIKHWSFQIITAMMIKKTLQVPTLLPNYSSHYIKHNNAIKMPLRCHYLTNFCLWCLYVKVLIL